MAAVPYAPHLLFPQFLDDADACQRAAGIEAGIEMLQTVRHSRLFRREGDRRNDTGNEGRLGSWDTGCVP